MTAPSLVISFGAPVSPELDDFVLLEQEAWDPYVNYLTKAGVIGFLNARLFQAAPVQENCSAADGSYAKTIYAYPSPAGLAYRLGCSHGSLGPREISILDYTEAIQCNLQTELTLKYPPLSITSYDWVGDAYDETGTIIQRPAVTIRETALTLAMPVYGTLLVTYQVMQHRTQVEVTPRDGALENRLTSFAFAVWSGGNTAMELEPPDGAEEGVCGSSITYGSVHFTTGDPGVPDSVPPENETISIDYCTMEVDE